MQEFSEALKPADSHESAVISVIQRTYRKLPDPETYGSGSFSVNIPIPGVSGYSPCVVPVTYHRAFLEGVGYVWSYRGFYVPGAQNNGD